MGEKVTQAIMSVSKVSKVKRIEQRKNYVGEVEILPPCLLEEVDYVFTGKESEGYVLESL